MPQSNHPVSLIASTAPPAPSAGPRRFHSVRRACAAAAVQILVMLASPSARAAAQAAKPQSPAFAVASVKPSDPNAEESGMRVLPGGGLNCLNVTLKQIVNFAYGVDDQGIVGLPDWAATSRYSIEARAPEGTPDGEVPDMLRALLADRFGMVTHEEARQQDVFDLVVAPGGLKLKPAVAVAGQPSGGARVTAGSEPGTMRLVASGFTLSNIPFLSRIAGRPIVDKTGITGKYDFDLEFSQDGRGPTIFTALEKTAGLKLQADKQPMIIIVVDQLRKPTPD